MNIDRYAAPVVYYGDAVIRVHYYIDGRGIAGHAFIDGIIDDLVYHVVEAPRRSVAYIHCGPFPDGVNAFQDLYCRGVVFLYRRGLIFYPLFQAFLLFWFFFAQLSTLP